MAAKKLRVGDADVSRIVAGFIVPMALSEVANVERLRALLSGAAATKPTHWSGDERTKQKFDEKIPLKNGAVLWRLVEPKYEGVLTPSVRTFSKLHLSYEAPKHELVPSIWEALLALGDQLTPVIGAVHLGLPKAPAKGVNGWTGVTPRVFEYFDVGPAGAFACTWFGPDLVSRIGERLLTTAGASMRRDGSARLMLHEHPWTLTAPELLSLQEKANEVLRTSGMLADYTAFPPRPGPKWVPIPRKIP